MNLIFAVITIASVAVLTIFAPDKVLPSMNSGITEAFELSTQLFCIYALWLGVFELLESSAISRLIAKILKKPAQLIFGSTSEKSQRFICLNLSANMLGLGGVATPMGIQAQTLLEKEGNTFAQNMLFVIASSSIQLLPVSVIGLRNAMGSSSAEDIIIPTLLSTAVSTVAGILLVKIFSK